jgi:sigma-B regulation protein RsbU (phosphoserine phosphatase)
VVPGDILPTKLMTAELEQNKAEIQAATKNLAEVFISNIPEVNSIFFVLTNYLNSNSSVFGATFAFSSDIKNAAPFVFRGENGLEHKDLASKFDYTKAVWYDVPVNLREPVWSVPYFDFGGSSEDCLLTTYSIPLFNPQDLSLIGVLASNCLLAKLEIPLCVPELTSPL